MAKRWTPVLCERCRLRTHVEVEQLDMHTALKYMYCPQCGVEGALVYRPPVKERQDAVNGPKGTLPSP